MVALILGDPKNEKQIRFEIGAGGLSAHDFSAEDEQTCWHNEVHC